MFCLCVDDYSIKYSSKYNTDYLCNAIGTNFRYIVDKEGKNYCGLTIKWNYKKGYIDISIPKYVPATLKNSFINKKFIHNTLRISIYQYNIARKDSNS